MLRTGSGNDGGKQQGLTKDKKVSDEKPKNRQASQSPWQTGTCQSCGCLWGHLLSTRYAVHVSELGGRKGHLTNGLDNVIKNTCPERLLIYVFVEGWKSRGRPSGPQEPLSAPVCSLAEGAPSARLSGGQDTGLRRCHGPQQQPRGLHHDAMKSPIIQSREQPNQRDPQ